ncbi:MAG: hypothetical protein ACR2OG_10505 [Gemmatimonadaceae bacterium]
MRVLVLDGNENQAVAAVRSLRRAGHDPAVGAATRWSKAGWSRDCAGTFIYPDPTGDAEGFVRRVAEEVRTVPGTLVLPMTERSTLPLSEWRQIIFGAGGRMVLPPHETLLRAFDKQETSRLAQSLGIAVPRGQLVTTDREAAEAAANVEYPVVLKPRSSEEISVAGNPVATGAPRYAITPAELLDAYTELRARCGSVLVQEYVAGAGAGYFALMRHGEVRGEFAHRRLRDVRPTGSGSALRVSVVPDPRVREAGLAILGALGWHGVAMVEFRLRPDGTPVFLEVNGRFWNSLALAVYAGADFPAALAELAEQGDVAPLPPARVGVRCRWLLGDARHLVGVWRGAPTGYPEPFPGRLRTLVAVVRPVAGTRHDNFMLRDPLPELADWLHFVGRRVPAALRKAARRASQLREARA